MTNFLGILVVTAYCATGHLDASDHKPIAGVTCASRTLPLKTKLLIENVGERIVTDRMNKRYNGQYLDIFVSSRLQAIQFGRQTNRVWILK